MTAPLDAQFDPAAIEAPLYRWWTERELYTVRADAPGAPYVIQMPPPNVTVPTPVAAPCVPLIVKVLD